MPDLTPEDRAFVASDGYPFHVAVWPAAQPLKGQVVVLHGVQSHSGWYLSLGRTLAGAGYQASCPDRRGSGPNQCDRGHASSGRRLVSEGGGLGFILLRVKEGPALRFKRRLEPAWVRDRFRGALLGTD